MKAHEVSLIKRNLERRLKIALDLDDTLFDFVGGLAKFHNKKYGTKLKREDYFSFKFGEVWGCNQKEAEKRVDEFHNSNDFRNALPVEGSLWGVNGLAKYNELYVITSREKTPYLVEQTNSWLNKYFPVKSEETDILLKKHPSSIFKEENIRFSRNHYTGRGEDLRTKREICDKLGIDLLIEDSLEYANQCVSDKRKALLLDSPWNREGKMAKGVIRTTWGEIPYVATSISLNTFYNSGF